MIQHFLSVTKTIFQFRTVWMISNATMFVHVILNTQTIRYDLRPSSRLAVFPLKRKSLFAR